MTIVAFVPNLFDRSRVEGRAELVDTPEAAAALRPRLVLVDLDRCPDPAAFRIDGATVIGFGPHVDTALHQEALDAGYDEVLARSVFFRRLSDLLDQPAPGSAR
jgi:hypothetical protein